MNSEMISAIWSLFVDNISDKKKTPALAEDYVSLLAEYNVNESELREVSEDAYLVNAVKQLFDINSEIDDEDESEFDDEDEDY